VLLVAPAFHAGARAAAVERTVPPTACDHAASARVAARARALGERGAFRNAVAAYTRASDLIAGCPPSDRAARIDAYVDAAHAVIAGATLAAATPRAAAEEAQLVRHATALRSRVSLDGAGSAQVAAVEKADRWVGLARALPRTPPPRARGAT
jgi:hypothetical protein